MTSDWPPDFGNKSQGGVLVVRENDVLAELCRALVRRDEVDDVIQEACERLQVYFGTASIGVWFVQDGDLVLKGLCVPDRFGEAADHAIREGYESVSLDDDLPGPRAMRERRTLRLAAGDPSLDPEVREILRMLDVSMLLTIPVYAGGDPIGCGLVGVPEEAPLTAADESLLENALGVLAILHHRDRLQKRDAALRRQILEASHMAAVGDLTATVAHEVNNPLGAVAQFAAGLLLDQGLPDDVRDTLEGIRAEAARAGLIIRSLLDFSRTVPSRAEAVDVGEAVERALHLLPEPFPEGMGVTVEIEPGTPAAWASPRGLRQVLHHLLVHARRAMEEARTVGGIRIEARATDDGVEIVVEDQGPALPDGYEDGAFTAFAASGERRHGMGLFLAHRVIREHGGTLRVEPWGEPGHEDPTRGGARFTVTLPRAEPGADTPGGKRVPDTAFDGLEILLVEDEALVAKATRKILERLGWRVSVCSSAEAALEEIRSGRAYHLILSDIRMPGIGGRGLYRTLEEDRPELLERVIFTSGDIVSPELREFLENTGRPILQKPYELSELQEALLETLQEVEQEEG